MSLRLTLDNPLLEVGTTILNDSILIIGENGISINAHADTIFTERGQIAQRSFEYRLDTTGMGDEMKEAVSMRIAAQKEQYKRFVESRIKRIDTLFRKMLIQNMGNTPIIIKSSRNLKPIL